MCMVVSDLIWDGGFGFPYRPTKHRPVKDHRRFVMFQVLYSLRYLLTNMVFSIRFS